MSRAPRILGSSHMDSPSSMGMANRNIMMLPCIVKIWLYSAVSRNAPSRVASCARISIASTPPMAKNTNEVAMNRSPIVV